MRDPSADNRIAALEAALFEYIERYGLTDRARAVFAVRRPTGTRSSDGSKHEPVAPERKHHD